MHKTRPLGSLRDIFPRIHQPLPMNQRESQRLLENIKTSFRLQLDREHGWVPPASTTVPRQANSTPAQHKTASAHPILPRATDRHVHAVLNNPLFSHATPTVPGPPQKSLAAHEAIFKKAVSRGLMNLTTAHGFLIHVASVPSQTSALTANPPPRRVLPTIGAGLLVLQWLRSSGQERDFEFLSNRKFVKALLPFLVTEGLDDVLWLWLKRLLRDTGPDYVLARHLLRDFVAERCSGRGLEAAFATILEADNVVKEMELPASILEGAWSWLAHEATTQAGEHNKLPAQLYDPFIAVGRRLRRRSTTLEMALVNLHHPVDPSPSLAVELLSSRKNWKIKGVLDADILDLYRLGIDTVRYLIQARNTEEASRLLDVVARNMRLYANPKRLTSSADLIPT
jgi:hypothetical protein